MVHRIEAVLREALAPEKLEVLDDSAAHAGHAGARGGGGHYRVTVVSGVFVGMPLLERHRLIYRLLAAEMVVAIHALALSTLAPGDRP